MDTRAECKDELELHTTASDIGSRFMAASKVLGEETVSGANGTTAEGATGRQNEK